MDSWHDRGAAMWRNDRWLNGRGPPYADDRRSRTRAAARSTGTGDGRRSLNVEVGSHGRHRTVNADHGSHDLVDPFRQSVAVHDVHALLTGTVKRPRARQERAFAIDLDSQL